MWGAAIVTKGCCGFLETMPTLMLLGALSPFLYFLPFVVTYLGRLDAPQLKKLNSPKLDERSTGQLAAAPDMSSACA